MNVILSGALGHMGKEVVSLAEAGYKGTIITAGVDPNASNNTYSFYCAESFEKLNEKKELVSAADIVVDFSFHGAAKELTDFAVKNNLPLVIATTGQTDEEKDIIKKASESIPVFFASNFSLGVALLVELSKKAAEKMPSAEIEIVEVHHDRKIDAPSGTALTIANAIKEVRNKANIVLGRSGMAKREKDDIGISSVRIGNVAGIHKVMIGTNNETITIKHEAHSRALFAEGALTAAEFLVGKKPGLYDMKSLV